jgi:hypothetical protein
MREEDRWVKHQKETEKESRNNEERSKKECEDIESETWALSQMFEGGGGNYG